MRLSRISIVLAGAAAVGLGCTGQIQTGSTTKGGNSTGPTGPMGPNDKPPPKDPPPVDVGMCNATTLAKPRVWRLTHTQLKNTLTDSLGFSPPTIDTFPSETRLDGFANQSNRLTVAPLLADYYLRASDELATNLLGRSAEFLKCPVSGLGQASCLGEFIRTLGMKMWRRPVTDAEVGKLTALYTSTVPMAGGPDQGFKNIVQAMFMSPNFLYRTELGNTTQAGQVTYLTDYELAAALSYMLWDSSPDKTLYDLAAANMLHDKDVLVQQAQRLWSTKKSQTALNAFMQQWLQIEELLGADKDPAIFPKYDKMVAADLLEESRLFLNSVVFDAGGDKSFKTLFTASYGFVNSRTAPIYGATSASAALTKTPLNGAQRKGLLTMGAFMAAHADGDDTGLVSRGRYFREEILCDHVPPPNPADAVFDPQKIRPDMTNRERLEAHTTNPVCHACHQLFDGLGFAMENYDPVGQYRTMDKGKMIDPTGSIPLPSGKTIEFKNFIDLVDQLAVSPDLYSCFSSQYLSYATGRGADTINACERKLVTDEFVQSGYKVDTLVMSVVKSPSFMARKN
ncbi:MAG TPA: DUF1592 domain-containing protein [Polyangia bacterium]|nr:DUF1592 domain-containing protein [Polyangia bacterium]